MSQMRAMNTIDAHAFSDSPNSPVKNGGRKKPTGNISAASGIVGSAKRNRLERASRGAASSGIALTPDGSVSVVVVAVSRPRFPLTQPGPNDPSPPRDAPQERRQRREEPARILRRHVVPAAIDHG